MTQAFNLSQFANKVNTSGQADLTTAITGTLPQANGGTGTTTAANGELLIGNGSGFTKATVTAGSGITVTNGSGAITIAASGGGSIQTELFTAPGTWTKPASCTQVRVTVIGGGSGAPSTSPPNVSAGGTSSFGSIASATGGPGTTGAGNGVGTVSVGTALKTGSYIVGGASGAFSLGIIAGMYGSGVQPAVAYTVGGNRMAGSGGTSGGSPGGLAIAIAPVSSPQPVTVGDGSNGANAIRLGGVGGAVVVEYVS